MGSYVVQAVALLLLTHFTTVKYREFCLCDTQIIVLSLGVICVCSFYLCKVLDDKVLITSIDYTLLVRLSS